MKKTLILLTSNRSVERKTNESISTLQRAGAMYLPHMEAPADIACARNVALSIACEVLRTYTERDVVLCVDDDMEFSLETAQTLVDATRKAGVGAGAVYATLAGTVAGGPIAGLPGKFECGMGLLALPREPLFQLERESESFEMAGRAFTEFVWCCAEDGLWVGEDYRLCRRLGGVQLLPVAAGHIKKTTLWPDAITLERVRDGAWEEGKQPFIAGKSESP